VVETGRIADRDAGGIYSTSAPTSAMGSSAHKQTRTLGSITKIGEIKKSGVHPIAIADSSALTMGSMTKTPIQQNNHQLEFGEIVPDRPLPSYNGTVHSACNGACESLSEKGRLQLEIDENIQMLCDLIGLHRI